MSIPITVEVNNLRKTFGKTVAVNDISFRIPPGRVFGFVGPNGSGKTTTLRIMATLDEPDCGDVFINGKSVIHYPEEGRRLIGFMPDALPESTDITSHEYLDFFGRAYGLRGAQLERRIEEVEKFTGLFQFRDKTLAALSKGMKQRVSLGRALVHDPVLLLLDEPAAGLDPRARIELRDMVNTLAKMGKTMLISSHILSELSEMCNGVIMLERGKLLRQGTLDEIASSPRNVCEVVMRVLQGEGWSPPSSPLLLNCRREGAEWFLTINGAETEAAALLAQLVQQGVKVSSFHMRRATLEDIFMDVTKGELA